MGALLNCASRHSLSRSLNCASTRAGSLDPLSPIPSQKRGPSLLFTARIERPPFYRGGSASKKSARGPVDSLSAPLLDFSSKSKSLKDPSFF
jgi:hypothetical protein